MLYNVGNGEAPHHVGWKAKAEKITDLATARCQCTSAVNYRNFNNFSLSLLVVNIFPLKDTTKMLCTTSTSSNVKIGPRLYNYFYRSILHALLPDADYNCPLSVFQELI